jgi:lipoprotein-anchoring transpeptidase ErfK/SrfK
MFYCLTIIINITLRTITCPNLNLSYPAAIPKLEVNRYYGEHKIRSILYKPKAYYNIELPSSKIGEYVICLDIPNKNSCLHGWYNEDVLGKAVSSECYRMRKQDIKELWFYTSEQTNVIITK